jgi:SHS2 domain-containing protein
MFAVAQHTADIRIEISAASPEEIFADGIRGLMEVMKPEVSGEGVTVTVEVESPDLTALLVDFMNEILLRCHIRREAFEPESILLHEHSVVARLRATPVIGFEEDVKAVTYHEADVHRNDDGSWTTTIVLDV